MSDMFAVSQNIENRAQQANLKAFYNNLNIIYLTLFYPKNEYVFFRKLTIIFAIKLLPHSILALLDLCFLQQGMKA